MRPPTEERFRALFESGAETIILLDASGTLQWASPSITGAGDRSMDEFVGHVAFEFVHPEDQPAMTSLFQRLVASPGTAVTAEFRALRNDGSWGWLEASAKNLLQDPRIEAIVCNYRDISDRKAAEESLRQSELRFRELIENSSDMIVLMAPNGTIQWASPSTSRLFGYSLPDEVIGQNAFDFVHPDDRQRLMDDYGAALRDPDGSATAQYRARHADGSWRWVEAVSRNLLHVPAVSAIVVNYRDITDRRTAEDTLKRSEEQFRSLIENASDIITVLEPNGAIRYMSPSIERVTGFRPEDTVSSTFFELVHPADIQEIVGAITKAVQNLGSSQSARFRVRHKNGEWRHLEGFGRAMLDDAGSPFGIINLRDLTGQIEAEDALSVQRRFSDATINSLPGVFYIFDHTGKFLLWNKNFELVSGYSADEIALMQPLDFIAGEDASLVSQRIQAVFLHGQSTAEAAFLTKAGDKIPHLFTGSRLTMNGVDCLCGLGIDITDRKLSEDALRESEARKGAVLETALDCIVSIDHEGRITEFNPAAEKTFGYSRDEVLGKQLADTVIPPALRSRHRDGFARYLASGEARIIGRRIELNAMRADGSEFPAEVSITRVPSEGPPAFTGYIRDISESKADREALQLTTERLRSLTAELERRVQERTAELKQINEELEAFAFSVSHDLRTQLRAMRGFGQAVLEDYNEEMEPATRDFTQRVVITTNEMDELIQDILDYSRVTRADVKLEPLTLALVIPDALRQLSSEIDARAAQIEIEPTTQSVLGHYQTLVQAIANLVANGIKFVAEETQPHIRIWPETRGECVRVWVEDNGIGIEPHQHKRIFEMFERLHGVEDYPGTGIGLAMVRRAIERMGGRVGVESDKGQGSRFWIELRPSESSIESPDPPRQGGETT